MEVPVEAALQHLAELVDGDLSAPRREGPHVCARSSEGDAMAATPLAALLAGWWQATAETRAGITSRAAVWAQLGDCEGHTWLRELDDAAPVNDCARVRDADASDRWAQASARLLPACVATSRPCLGRVVRDELSLGCAGTAGAGLAYVISVCAKVRPQAGRVHCACAAC